MAAPSLNLKPPNKGAIALNGVKIKTQKMANLKDLNFSMQGEPTQKGQDPAALAEVQITEALVRDAETQKEETWHVFRLKQSNKKGGVYLPSEEDAYNPKTKKIERMRLLNGVPEIWASEQKHLTPEFIKMNRRTIHFARGTKIIRVPSWDTALLEFLRTSNNNMENPKRTAVSGVFDFYEFDPAKEARLAMQKEEFELEMALEAKGKDTNYMKKHCAFLGIKMYDEITQRPKEDDQLRREYIIFAKRNPQHFKNTMGGNQVDIFAKVKSAFNEHLIEINRVPNQIHWAKGGELVAHYPKGEDPIRFLTNLALTPSSEGIRFKQLLDQLPV